ncbi:DUF636 domain-containing protein [Xylogone sp. PMI_703]|nr:DUF636 domain-containing protein [Xylogone sp. PMI_703]
MAAPTRRAYHGSCHCGLIRYVAYITLPPSLVELETDLSSTKIYKCNCTTCMKASIFHVRLFSAPEDFLLLSPISREGAEGGLKLGEGGLKDYTCFAGNIHFYFCSNCGVRCFSLAGKGELKTVPAESIPPAPQLYLHDGQPILPQDVETKEGQIAVWSPKKEGWDEGAGPDYLSVNATSFEPGQEGLDLREWSEKGWIGYLEYWKRSDEYKLKKPFEGGMY